MNTLDVLLFAEAADGRRILDLPVAGGNGAAQCLYHLATQGNALALATRMQQRHAASEMVEHQQGSRREVVRFRSGLGLRDTRRQALEAAHQIVARGTHQAARQRHPGNLRTGLWRTRQGTAQCTQQLGLGLRRRPDAPVDAQAPVIEPDLEAIAEADERIARQPFAALDAFQQKAGLERLEFQIGRDWGVQVCGDVEGWLH